jgi:probable F420-dependent oxidoreductase
MKLGVVFPQTEIGNDPAVIREYAQTAEALGYNHVLAFDHVLGAHPDHFNGRPVYNHETPFHEPFVLFGFLAAVTQTLELVTGVIILPQRQTALVAKQAAAVDVLSGGRLRLGIGVGWNHVEYEGLGKNFKDRGRRVEEQVALMRALWTQELVDFEGKHESVHRAGIRPLPVQRPIPIWFGGTADVVLRRVARIGDGWFPQQPPGPDAAEAVEQLRRYTLEAGRRPEDIGLEPRLNMGRTPEAEWATVVEGWRDLGATHLCVNTMGMGLASPQAHIDTIRSFAEGIGAPDLKARA